MNYTKQDIQKLAAQLAKVGVKDSQFSTLSSPLSTTKVTALHDGVNYTISLSALLKFIEGNIDLDDITVADNDNKSTTLLTWLRDIATAAETKFDGEGNPLTASNVSCTVSIGDTSYGKVSEALSAICGILSGISQSPNTASDTEIINILTT